MNAIKPRWNTKYFTMRLGRPPEEGELERATCAKAGQYGHKYCGICEHDYPRYACLICTSGTQLNLPLHE